MRRPGSLFSVAVVLWARSADAQVEFAVVAWAEGGAASGDGEAAAAAASAILLERNASAPADLGAASSVAAGCADAACVAGLGVLAGAANVVAIAVGVDRLRLVVVAVSPEARETARVERAIVRPVSDWRAAVGPAIEEAIGPARPPIVASAPALAAGALVLRCNVAGAQVTIDGVLVGETPLPRRALSPGMHVVHVSKVGWSGIEARVQVQGGADATVEAWLRAPPAPAGPAPEEPEGGWYGYQTLIVDALAIGVAVGSANPFVWFGGYLLGPPVVHAIHSEPASALGSLAMRVGFPLGGALLFAVVSDDEEGAIAGLVLGLLAAIAFDAAVLAYEEPETGSRESWLGPLLIADGERTILGAQGRF